MERYIVTVLPGGRITIPAAVRRDLDLHPGDTLIWWWEGREIHFRKAEAGEITPDAGHPEVAESVVDREAKGE